MTIKLAVKNKIGRTAGILLTTLILAPVSVFLAPDSARASLILPEPIYSLQYGLSVPGSVDYYGHVPKTFGGALGADDYSIFLEPQLVLESHAFGAGSHTFEKSGAGEAYYFEISGPSAENIPLRIQYGMAALATGHASVDVQIVYPTAPVGPTSNGLANDQISAINIHNFGIAQETRVNTVTSYLSSNTEYFISMQTQTFASDIYFDGYGNRVCCTLSSAVASVDPFLQIDPTYANANKYSIEFSPGVTNGKPLIPTPEPSSGGMLLFGTLGLMLCNHRRKLLRARRES